MKGSQYGEFVLESPIGQGGMGSVWRARHLKSNTVAALKIVHAQADPTTLAAFDAEVGAVARCTHPNIVRIFDFGVRGHEPWLAMEFVPGGDLSATPPRSWTELRDVLLQILGALAHAHARGIVHRDLKPANILSGADVKVTDFGLAHRGGRGGTEEQIHVAAGTPYFMAPEQLLGQWRDFGAWTDLYALGCVAYDLAVGRPPFVASHVVDTAAMHLSEPVPPLQPRFPVAEGFEAWVGELLAKPALRRLASAAEAAALLSALEPPKLRGGSVDRTAEFDADTLPLSTLMETLAMAPQPLDVPTMKGRAWAPTQIPKHAPADFQRSWGLERESLRLFSLRPTPLTGREAEVEFLWDALRDVKARGVSRVVLIRGPGGCGKSRLARWLGEAAHEYAGCRVFRTTHHVPAVETDGLRGLLIRGLRLDRLSPREAYDRLAEILRANDCPEMLQPVAAFLRYTDAAAFSPSTHHQTLRNILAVAGRGHPCVVVLDDIHVDDESLAFVESVVREPDALRAPLLVLATLDEQVQSEAVDRTLSRTEFDILSLPPLDVATVSRIVRDELRIDPELATEIAELAGGFTVYAMQAVGQLIQSGELLAGERGLVRATPGVVPRISQSAEELWRRHVDQFLAQEDAILIVGAGAALGAEVADDEIDPVMAALGVPGGDAALVGRLIRAGLVERNHGAWSLRYAPFRRAVDAELRRRGHYERVHRAIAGVLGAKARTAAESARVCHHYLEGGALQETAWFACDAIAAAIRSDGQNNEALRRALDVAARAAEQLGGLGPKRDRIVRIGRATECQNIGRADEALAWLKDLPTEGDDLDDYATLIRAIVHQLKGELPQARRVLADAIEQSGVEAPMRVRLLRALARVSLRLGDVDESRERIVKALELLATMDDPVATGWCHYRLAQISRHRGELRHAHEANERARGFFDAGGFQIGIGETTNLRGELLRADGQLLQAIEAYTQAHGELTRAGASWAIVPRLNRGIAAVLAGQAASLHEEVEDIRDRLHGRQFELLHLIAALLACAVAADREDRAAFDALVEPTRERLHEFQSQDEDISILLDWIARRWTTARDEARATALHRQPVSRSPS